MRITYNSLIDSISTSMQSNLTKLQNLQERLSSGKTISKPSDDPVASINLSIFKTKKSQYGKYMDTIDKASSWLETTENALNQINSTMIELRDICIQGANESLTLEGRHSLLLKVEQLEEKMLNDANLQHLGNHIFSGLKTNQRPFIKDLGTGQVQYLGDQGVMVREISFESTMDINIDGARLFNMDNAVSGDPNLFEVIGSLKQALGNGDTEKLSDEVLLQLDRAETNIINIYSEIGSKVNRLDLTRVQHENALLTVDKRISTTEDIDIAEVIMDLKKAEMVYMTSLNVAGRIFPPSLLDYLK